jgi:hypothetical protein
MIRGLAEILLIASAVGQAAALYYLPGVLPKSYEDKETVNT